MRSRSTAQNKDSRQVPNDDTSADGKPPDCDPEPPDTSVDAEEASDLEDSNLQIADDDRWDVFILDDAETDPLPDYGDFWFPD